MKKSIQKINKYFSAHVYQNSLSHVALGIGIGIYVTYMFEPYPARFAFIFIALGILGHLYAYVNQK